MLNKYVYPKKKSIILTMAIKILSTLFGVLIPTILAYIIDDIVPKDQLSNVNKKINKKLI